MYLHSFTGENSPNEQGVIQQDGLTADGRVSDLARWQAMSGISYSADRYPLTVTLLGQYVGARDTVASNPVDRVAGYQTYDLTLRLREPAGLKGWELGLTVSNLTNTRYFHPGVSSANAGDVPGSFAANQVWHGSQGFYSSLLAQPGRSTQLLMRFGF